MKKLLYIIVLTGAFVASYYVTKEYIIKPKQELVPDSIVIEQKVDRDSNIVNPDPAPAPVSVEISNEELKELILSGKYAKDERIAEKCLAEYIDANNRNQQKNLSFIRQQIKNKKWRDIKVESSDFDGNNGKVSLVRITPNINEEKSDTITSHVIITNEEMKKLILSGKYEKDKRIAKEYSIQYMDVSDDDIEGLQQNLTFVQQQIEFGNWKDFSVNGIDYDKKSGKVNIIKIQPIY